jgi:hypothetical protein
LAGTLRIVRLVSQDGKLLRKPPGKSFFRTMPIDDQQASPRPKIRVSADLSSMLKLKSVWLVIYPKNDYQ